MRFGGWIIALLLPLVVACKLVPQATDLPPPTVQDQSATTMDGGAVANTGVRPKPRPTKLAVAPKAEAKPAAAAPVPDQTVPVDPVAQKSDEQIICEKRGGNWDSAGKSKFKTCIKVTRDSGKQCRKKGDCESECLARSNTCAPVKPLFGCNEILQKDGSRVTLCID